MEGWQQKADEFLADSFIEPFSSERFDANRFISEMINQSSVENLIDLITQLEVRERGLDAFFRALCESNPDFVENQFAVPQTMATLFDALNSDLQQNKRRATQAKAILNFNAEQLRTLTEEIRLLRGFNEGLQQIETLNDMMIEFAVYMKRGLLWGSAQMCRRIDVKIRLFRDSVGRDNATLVSAAEYFLRQLKSKREELFYILREELYRLLYEGLIEQMDAKSAHLWAEGGEGPAAPTFLAQSPLYEFLEDGILGDSTLEAVSAADLPALRRRLDQAQSAHAGLVDMLFDADTYSIIRSALADNFAVDLHNEPKLFEVMASTREAMLQEKLFAQLAESIDAKLPMYIAKSVRFFIFATRNHQLWAGKGTQPADESSLTGINVQLSLGSHFCRAITVLLQRLVIALKAGEQKKPAFIFAIFEKVLDHVKYFLERLLSVDERQTTDELSLALRQLRAFISISPTSYFVLVAQFNLHVGYAVGRAAALLDVPQLAGQLAGLLDLIGQYLTSLFAGRVERGFEAQVVVNKRLEDFAKVETTAEESLSAGDRLTGNVAYSAFLLQKRISIELYTAQHPFFRRLSVALIVSGPASQAAHAKLLATANRLLGHFADLHERRLMKHPVLKSCPDTGLPHWRRLRQLAQLQLLHSERDEAPEGLPPFAQPPKDNFWNSAAEFEFYEKAFIALTGLQGFFSELRAALLVFWAQQPAQNLEAVVALLGTPLPGANAEMELLVVHRAAQAQGLVQKLRARLAARAQPLSFEEHLVLFLSTLLGLTETIADLFLHLKYNFDLMLNGFFGEEEEEESEMLPLGTAVVFKTLQVNEFRSLLLSFDRLFARYMSGGELPALFRAGSLRLFYTRLRKHILAQSAYFMLEEKAVRGYYLSFRDILEASSVFGECKAEIQAFTAEYVHVFREAPAAQSD